MTIYSNIVLNNMVSFEQRPSGLAGEFFDLLFSSTDLSKFANEDRIKYLNDMTTERDIRNQISFAHDKGKAEGKVEGKIEGREEGRAEGVMQVATKLKAQGISIDVISNATGLSKEQINNL